MKKPNELTEEIVAPAKVIAALMTGRTELLKLAAKGPVSAEEAAALYNAIRILMDTNKELQDHSQRLATEMQQLRGALRGMARKFDNLYMIANFTEGDGAEEDA